MWLWGNAININGLMDRNIIGFGSLTFEFHDN